MSYNNPEILDLYSIRNSSEFLWFKLSNYTQTVIEPSFRYIYQNKYDFSYNELALILSFMTLVYSLLLQFYLITYNKKLYRKYTNLLEEYKFSVRASKNRKIEIEKLKDAIKTRNHDLFLNDKDLEIANNKVCELKRTIKTLKNDIQSINENVNNNFKQSQKTHHMILRKKK